MVPHSQNNFKIEMFENDNFSFEILEFTLHGLLDLESFLELQGL